MKKRSKYKPKPIRVDVMSYVKLGFSLADEQPASVDLRIKYHESMRSIVYGDGDRGDVDVLVNAINMAQAFCKIRPGLGAEFKQDIDAAHDALLVMAKRGVKFGHFAFTGPELQTMNYFMQIHDAQLSAATVGEVEQGCAIVRKVLASGKATRIHANA